MLQAWLAGEGPGPGPVEPLPGSNQDQPAYSLFAYPAYDNYAGVIYPKSWVRQVQALSTDQHKWKVGAARAALVLGASSAAVLSFCGKQHTHVAGSSSSSRPWELGFVARTRHSCCRTPCRFCACTLAQVATGLLCSAGAAGRRGLCAHPQAQPH